MRRTRFLGWFFIALSVAFFCVEDFRWALQLSQLTYLLVGGTGRFAALWEISRDDLKSLRRSAESSGNAEQLAFLSLHWPREDRDDVLRMADQAVAKDPKYVWIYYEIAGTYRDVWRADAAVAKQMEDRMAKVEAFDHGNALPYLWRGEFIRERAKDWPKMSGGNGQGSAYWSGVAAHPDWLAAMGSAFEQPRYDSYSVKRFDLERSVMGGQGWATPARMLLSVVSYQIPNLLNVREYAQFSVKQAAEKEKAGHADEALRQDIRTSSFGVLMRVQGPTLIEQLIGMAVEKIALEAELEARNNAADIDEARRVE